MGRHCLVSQMSEADKVRKLEKLINDALKGATRKKTLDEVGKLMADRIRLRTRLGKGVSQPTGGSPKPLAKLAPSTVRGRASFKGLSGDTTPSKSNLTRTGELLDSITHKVEDNGFILYLEGQHESGLSNDKLAEYLSEGRGAKAVKAMPDKTKKQRKRKSRLLKALRKLSKLFKTKKTAPIAKKPRKSGPTGEGMPARPFMGVTNPEYKFLLNELGERIASNLAKALKGFK